MGAELAPTASRSQSPDGDFFDPDTPTPTPSPVRLNESQSPDGDFFDPEGYGIVSDGNLDEGHSPLTGIFLIRIPDPARIWSASG